MKKSRAGRQVPYEHRKHATEDDRRARFFGMESRQVLRALLRRTHGHEPGKKKYRELMGLGELWERKGSSQ